MDQETRTRRDRAADRHDAALANWPTRASEEFLLEMRSVVEELESVAETADRPASDPVEVAKTYRWLGDAYSDLARSKDKSLLQRGIAAYLRAEELLADSDAPVERAKLDFNFGNALRALSGGFDVGLLEAAVDRFKNALEILEKHHLTDQVRRVEQALRLVEPQIPLARKRSELERGSARLSELMEQVKTADAADRDAIGAELRKLIELAGRGNPVDSLEKGLEGIEPVFVEQPEKLTEDATSASNALPEAMADWKAAFAAMSQSGAPREEAHPANVVARELMERLARERAAGTVSGDRADSLHDVFDQFMNVVNEGDEDLESLRARTQKMRALTSQIIDKGLDPSWSSPEPQEGTRAHRLVALLDPLKRFIVAEKMQPMLPSGVASEGSDLMIRLMKLEHRVREHQDDESALDDMEDETWRLAAELQEYARRDHLMLAAPHFPTIAQRTPPKSVFVSGPSRLHETARGIVSFVALRDVSGGRYPDQRWRDLRSATLAIFDIGDPDSSARAQVCYELGLALALGKPVVVALRKDQHPPFNVRDDFPFLRYDPVRGLAADDLEGAIWHAVGLLLWGGHEANAGGRLEQTLSWLDGEFPELSEGSLRLHRDRLGRAAREKDSVDFRTNLDQLIGELGSDAPVRLLPAWPPAYPRSDDKPRCFHVTPFGPDWADETRETVRGVCNSNGWHYARGDEAEDQRIVRGIWTEIARSSAVVVDLTGRNENVALELGLAHALGRKHLVVTQDDPEKGVFRSLGRDQVRPYGMGPRGPSLSGLVESFLA
ncbi:MAG: hypothetical protein AAF726_08350 [Planctomycetota bacterium]